MKGKEKEKEVIEKGIEIEIGKEDNLIMKQINGKKERN